MSTEQPRLIPTMTPLDVIEHVLSEPDFMREYDRLHGTRLGPGHAPIVAMVDRATGKREEEMAEFVRFVMRYIWPVTLVAVEEEP